MGIEGKMDEARRNWEKVLLDASTFLQEQTPVDEWSAKEGGVALKSLRKDKNKKRLRKRKILRSYVHCGKIEFNLPLMT